MFIIFEREFAFMLMHTKRLNIEYSIKLLLRHIKVYFSNNTDEPFVFYLKNYSAHSVHSEVQTGIECSQFLLPLGTGTMNGL